MITLIAAPTNLGLRPPQPGSMPGASKAPEALREAGLFTRLAALGADDRGVVLPGRYVDDDSVRPPGRLRNERAIIDHALRLADRVELALDQGNAPLVIGGDCSVLVAVGIATARREHIGLIHIDGHTDFRHPGNSDTCASLAGEDLAAAVGLHWDSIANIAGLAPYFAPQRAVHIGHRDLDEHAHEVADVLGCVIPAASVCARGTTPVSAKAMAVAGDRYWLQVDVDVLDPTVMPAVDCPDPGGLAVDELTDLVRALAPNAVGASVTVFDPDLDPDGVYARLLTEVVVAGFARLGSAYP